MVFSPKKAGEPCPALQEAYCTNPQAGPCSCCGMGDMFEFRRAAGRGPRQDGGRKEESTRIACRNDGARPVVCPIQPIDYESVCPFPHR